MIQEEYNPEAVEAFAKAGKAIPGQSLTSNPDEPRPFESPPEFTNFKEALDYTVGELLEEEAYMSIVGAIGDGVPIVDLVMQITYVGFREGKWNPDLMMMLVEPLILSLIHI